MKKYLPLFFVLLFAELLYPCTTAIISGKYTKDGRPLLLKHRDTNFLKNKLKFFDDGKFDYIGLINASDKEGKEVWAGLNEAGFAIMNSASYNLKSLDDSTSLQDLEGKVMKLALQNCKTIDDFEDLLRTLKKPLGVEANFGVIDAAGGAAYFEVNNFEIRKIDVNDPAVAPFGFVVRTNFSAYGRKDEGKGYIRYLTAEQLLNSAAAKNNLDFKFLLQDVSRSLKNSLLGTNYNSDLSSEKENKFVVLQDYIVRYSSASTVVVQGVRESEKPELSTMWTILGFQLTSVAVPVWVKAGNKLPAILTAPDTLNAPLCKAALELKDKCFPVKRGSGKRYLLLNKVVNKKGTGILQLLLPVENKIIRQEENLIEKWRRNNSVSVKEVERFYSFATRVIKKKYKKLFGIKYF